MGLQPLDLPAGEWGRSSCRSGIISRPCAQADGGANRGTLLCPPTACSGGIPKAKGSCKEHGAFQLGPKELLRVRSSGWCFCLGKSKAFILPRNWDGTVHNCASADCKLQCPRYHKKGRADSREISVNWHKKEPWPSRAALVTAVRSF